jgi:hypothetical protein
MPRPEAYTATGMIAGYLSGFEEEDHVFSVEYPYDYEGYDHKPSPLVGTTYIDRLGMRELGKTLIAISLIDLDELQRRLDAVANSPFLRQQRTANPDDEFVYEDSMWDEFTCYVDEIATKLDAIAPVDVTNLHVHVNGSVHEVDTKKMKEVI